MLCYPSPKFWAEKESGPLGHGGWVGGGWQMSCFLNWTEPSISRAWKGLWVPVQGQGGGGILQVLGPDPRPLGSSFLLLSQRLQ